MSQPGVCKLRTCPFKFVALDFRTLSFSQVTSNGSIAFQYLDFQQNWPLIIQSSLVPHHCMAIHICAPSYGISQTTDYCDRFLCPYSPSAAKNYSRETLYADVISVKCLLLKIAQNFIYFFMNLKSSSQIPSHPPLLDCVLCET